MPGPRFIGDNLIIEWVVGTSHTTSTIKGIWYANPKADDTVPTPIVVARAIVLRKRKLEGPSAVPSHQRLCPR
jgi:hypothetical protein